MGEQQSRRRFPDGIREVCLVRWQAAQKVGRSRADIANAFGGERVIDPQPLPPNWLAILRSVTYPICPL
jgi:hypothetical protein